MVTAAKIAPPKTARAQGAAPATPVEKRTPAPAPGTPPRAPNADTSKQVKQFVAKPPAVASSPEDVAALQAARAGANANRAGAPVQAAKAKKPEPTEAQVTEGIKAKVADEFEQAKADGRVPKDAKISVQVKVTKGEDGIKAEYEYTVFRPGPNGGEAMKARGTGSAEVQGGKDAAAARDLEHAVATGVVDKIAGAKKQIERD